MPSGSQFQQHSDVLALEMESDLEQRLPSSGTAASATTLSPLKAGDDKLEDGNGTGESNEKQSLFLHGIRLYLLTAAIWLIIYMVNMEASIVSTALVAISNDLDGFYKSSWIVSGYQISYTGFLVIWAKMSDIFGRKHSLIAATFVFVVFSAACGAAQSMTQLIVFRVLQGSGAAGAFAVTMALVYQMVPKSKLPLYTGFCFVIVALATTSGPLIGGAVVTQTSWRWVFLLNVPAGAFVIVLLLILMPANLGNEGNVSPSSSHKETSWNLLKKIDAVGAVLLVGGSFLLVTALLEASTALSWSSATIIVLLVLSLVFLASFIWWERLLGTRPVTQEAMFPWRFVENRPWMGMLLISFLVGIPTSVILISIPQRFQIVDGSSALQAGIRLLPYTIANPFGLIIGNAVGGATKIPPIYLMLASSCVQLLGLGLLDLIPIQGGMNAGMYVFEIIIALGVGVTASLTMLATPHCIQQKDIAVGTSSMVQARMMGSAIGLAIAYSVVNSYLSSSLGSVLPAAEISSLLQNFESISGLDPSVQVAVREVFGKAFRLENWIIIGIAGAQTLAVGLMWKRPQVSLHTT